MLLESIKCDEKNVGYYKKADISEKNHHVSNGSLIIFDTSAESNMFNNFRDDFD